MSIEHIPDLAMAVSPADHVLGAAHAPVRIVEYGDFECPHGKQAAPALKHIISGVEGRVRLVSDTSRTVRAKFEIE